MYSNIKALLRDMWIALMRDTCASTPTKDLNCLLLMDKDAYNSSNHYSYMRVSMHVADLLILYSYRSEQGEAY